jgi:hypothetical protein
LAQEVDPNERASNECVRAGSSSEDIVRKTCNRGTIHNSKAQFKIYFILYYFEKTNKSL